MPVICSLYYKEGDLFSILISGIITLAMGLPLAWYFRKEHELNIKDGFFIAVFGWVLISALSGLPFMIYGAIPSFTDAFFEMMSGYTTSGATILTDIEIVPHGLLFWRSQTHLLGGMGFLTLTVIFLPHGMGGLRIFRAESSPGQVITKERFMPRNRDAMIWLWGIYLTLNLLETFLLCVGGMSIFDSLCHSFGTVSTSGYSPKNASIGHYNNAYFDWIITLFMFLGGMTFLLFFCGMVTWILWKENTYGGLLDSMRYGTFQVMSILTTTGFTTADYEKWPQAAQMFLLVSCFIGACAGSTTSGIKIVHYVIICKYMYASVKKHSCSPCPL